MLGGGGRDLMTDQVDHAAQRARAVEQRHRPAHHLDPLGGEWVDRDRVIHRGRREIPGALTILEDHDAIPAHPADHRASRGRPHLRHRDARGPDDRGAQGAIETPIEARLTQDTRRGDRIARSALRDLPGNHGRRHLHRLLPQCDRERDRLISDHDWEIRGPVPDALHHQPIAAGWDGPDEERAVLASTPFTMQLDETHDRTGQRRPGSRIPDGAGDGHGARALRRHDGWHKTPHSHEGCTKRPHTASPELMRER